MKTEFMAVIIVETKQKMQPKDVEKVRKWLQKSLTVDIEDYENRPIQNQLYNLPKAIAVASPGTSKDWDEATKGVK